MQVPKGELCCLKRPWSDRQDIATPLETFLALSILKNLHELGKLIAWSFPDQTNDLLIFRKKLMMTKHFLLSIALFTSLSIGLTACGGGNGNSNTVVNDIDDTVDLFDGTWVNACTFDASENQAEKLTTTIDANTMEILYSQYTTQDCSDTAKLSVDAIADLEYKGEQATGDCTAEKVVITVTSAKVNGISLTATQLATLIAATDLINSPQFDLICTDSENALRRGDTSGDLDGSTAAKRPTTMDMSGEGAIKQ